MEKHIKDYNEIRDWLKQRDLTNANIKATVRLYEASLIKQAEETGKGCDRCGLNRFLTIDHIVPQGFLLSVGINSSKELLVDNLQVLCVGCNKLKGGNFDLVNPKTKKVLKEVFEKILK